MADCVCTKCGGPKTGKHGWCNPCNAAQRRIYYLKNKDLVLSVNARSRKNSGGAWDKRYREENKATVAAGQKRNYIFHKAERNAASQAYYRSNRDAILLRHKGWERKNKELCSALAAGYRARKKNAPTNDLTLQQWLDIKSRFSEKCAYCGSSGLPLTKDHVVPLSRGGGHTASNIVPACLSCNCSKKAKSAEDFLRVLCG